MLGKLVTSRYQKRKSREVDIISTYRKFTSGLESPLNLGSLVLPNDNLDDLLMTQEYATILELVTIY